MYSNPSRPSRRPSMNALLPAMLGMLALGGGLGSAAAVREAMVPVPRPENEPDEETLRSRGVRQPRQKTAEDLEALRLAEYKRQRKIDKKLENIRRSEEGKRQRR